MTHTEKDITQSIRQYLKYRGIFHYKQWQGLGSKRGVSDIIGIFKGRFMAIEVKRQDRLKCPNKCNHKTCRQQWKFLTDVVVAGGIAIVARSADDVAIGLEGIK